MQCNAPLSTMLQLLAGGPVLRRYWLTLSPGCITALQTHTSLSNSRGFWNHFLWDRAAGLLVDHWSHSIDLELMTNCEWAMSEASDPIFPAQSFRHGLYTSHWPMPSNWRCFYSRQLSLGGRSCKSPRFGFSSPHVNTLSIIAYNAK